MNIRLSNNLILLACTVSCLGFFMTPNSHEGVLTPIDPEICISENVTFKCTLLSPPDQKHKIGFAIQDSNTNRKYVRVEQDKINVINETMSTFTLYNLTSRIFVRCIYGETPTDVDVTKSLGYTSSVQTYPSPKKVEDIVCIVNNYYDSMNCSWNYSTNYKLGTYPEVKFHWRIPQFSASWNNCPDLNRRHGFCHWKSTRVGDFSMKLIDIQITLKQPCGMNVSSNFTIDTTKIVRPNPVNDLTSSAINSTCVIVQYRTSHSEKQFPKEHRILISSKWKEPNEILFSTTHSREERTHRKTVCNLHPYTKYTFSVSIQPTERQAGYFSYPRIIEVTTYSDIPSSSPVVAEGGYSVNTRDCKHGKTERRICVPMKPIKEEDENGPMKGVVISVTSTETDLKFEEDFIDVSTYACLSNIQCNTSYMISVKARNVNGTSVNYSSLLIPAVALAILPPDVQVEAEEETGDSTAVYLSWTATENTIGYMSFWCRNRNGNCATRSEVNWKNFPMNTTKGVIQIENGYFPQDFLYGVSALTENGSSGIEWQDCVYLRNTYPKREPKNVVVSLGSEDRTLVVTWDKLMCSSDEPYIEMYNVRYRKLYEDKHKSVNVSSLVEARVTINNLEYGQSYVVTVRGVTKQGKCGPESQPNKVTMKQNVPICKLLKFLFSKFPRKQCAIQPLETSELTNNLENFQNYGTTVREVTKQGFFESESTSKRGTFLKKNSICKILRDTYSTYQCDVQPREARETISSDQDFSVIVNDDTEQGYDGPHYLSNEELLY